MTQKYMKIYSISVICSLVLMGCASTYRSQFERIPHSLKGVPEDQLSLIHWESGGNVPGLRYKDLKIDGNEESFGRIGPFWTLAIFLAPGTHSIEYYEKGVSADWKNLKKSMQEKGYILQPDGKTFVKVKENGGHLTARPIGISRYGWVKMSKVVTLEAGKTYKVNDL